jgi:dihydroneopterin aldolase
VLDEEQVRAQPFEVDLDLELDLARAAETDDLVDTVDYGAVVDMVVAVVSGARSFRLLEAMAGAIASGALEDERVGSVTVAVRKLHPPLAADVGTVGVRLTLGR